MRFETQEDSGSSEFVCRVRVLADSVSFGIDERACDGYGELAGSALFWDVDCDGAETCYDGDMNKELFAGEGCVDEEDRRACSYGDFRRWQRLRV